MIGALGVVYGDIGTSPLYTMRACLTNFDELRPEHVLGVLSILFWLLMLVVSFKYVTLVLRADNRGEGGTLALLELAVRGRGGRMRHLLVALGIFGAALFYGDSMITPAISVLSAHGRHRRGLAPTATTGSCRCPWWCWWRSSPSSRAAPAPWASCSVRSWRCGSCTLGVLGVWQIVADAREVLAAFNPLVALRFVAHFAAGELPAAGRGGAGPDGRGGALRRHGPLRPTGAIRRAWFWLVAAGA